MTTDTAIRSFLIVFLLSTAGCTTMDDARVAKGTGSFRLYNESFDTVWDAAIRAVYDVGLNIESKTKNEGYILARMDMSLFSMGENVAVFVERADEQRTRVEVVSKKVMPTNVLAPNWEMPILDRISERLPKK